MKRVGLIGLVIAALLVISATPVMAAKLTCNATVDVNNLTIVFFPVDQMPWHADGKLYNMTIYINDTLGDTTVNCTGEVQLTFNTSMAWINNGTGGSNIAIVSVTNGITDPFSVAAFNNQTYGSVIANLTAEAVAVNESNPAENATVFNYTILTFNAPSQLAWITGDYRKVDGTPLNETEVGGVWITITNEYGFPLYYYLDTTPGAGYSARVPLGNYYVQGDAMYYQATSNTVNVSESERTFTADLVFVSDRKPTTVVLTYEDGSKNKANPANGDEKTDEMLIVKVYDQYGDLITDTVTVTIEPPGDLNVNDPDVLPDGNVDTAVTVTASGGVGYVWVTSLNATKDTMPGAIVTVNITATSNTNSSAFDTATKTYVLKGNSSILGQVYYVNEETGEKGPAVGATVWAAYAGMSNHSLAYIQSVFSWLVDTTDEHGVYVLDGIAGNDTVVFIYVVYDGWNGINDTIGAPSLSSIGVLDPESNATRGGRTNMFIAEAEYEHIRMDGDTENHDIKLRTPEPIRYTLDITEPRHVLTIGEDSVVINVTLQWWPKSDPSDVHPANGTVTVSLNNSLAVLDNGTVKGQSVNVEVTNGIGYVTIISGDSAGAVEVNATFTYYDLETKQYVTVWDSEVKTIVDVARISGDLTDESGTQLNNMPLQLVVALWLDYDGDKKIDTSVDCLVRSYASYEVRSGIDSLSIIQAINPGARYCSAAQLVNISDQTPNPRFSDPTFGHYSFFDVPTGFNYVAEGVWIAKEPLDTNDAISQIQAGNYSVSYVPFYLEPNVGTKTVDIAMATPPGYEQPTGPGTSAEMIKQEIINLIVEYLQTTDDNVKQSLKQEIINKIVEYLNII